MGQPIRGVARPLPVKAGIIPVTIPPKIMTLDANFNASIHNRFDVEVIDAQTGKIKQRALAENVICSQLWTRLFAPNAYFNCIHYGTGSGTPASTDTQLFAFLGYGTPASGEDASAYDSANHVYSYRRKIQLSETTAVGSTLTEVGIGYDTSSSSLCTHAMLKDANGNQISIAKTNTDIINVYATVYAHWSSNYDAYIGFSSDSSTLKYCVGMGTSMFGSATLIGQSSTVDMTANVTYTQSSKTIAAKFTRLGASSGNYTDGGFTGICMDQRMIMLINPAWFSPPAIIGEAIGAGNGAIKDFSTDFRDISGLAVYVDGVEATGITITSGVPLIATNPWKNFIFRDANGKLLAINNSGSQVTLSGLTTIMENPYYNVCGVTSLGFVDTSTYKPATVSVSNDMTAWTSIASNQRGIISISSSYQNYRYFKIEQGAGSFYQLFQSIGLSIPTNTNIHFAAAPANGAVITADYTPGTIAKDANHVFDLTVTIQLGEYTA